MTNEQALALVQKTLRSRLLTPDEQVRRIHSLTAPPPVAAPKPPPTLFAA